MSSVKKYILFAVGAIVLMLIGILLNLQINNWNEERKAAIEESNSDISDDISGVNKDFMSGVANQDAAAIADVYTEDGQVLPPNAETGVGKANIQVIMQGFFDSGVRGLKLESIEIESYGDNAYELGKYTLLAEGEVEVDKGKYIVIWKKVDGEWKYYRDIFNSDFLVIFKRFNYIIRFCKTFC